MVLSTDSFLLLQFRELYREVIRWKQKVGRNAFREESGSPEAPAALAPVIWQALVAQLDRQTIAVRRGGGEYAAEVFREAQYVMAALADEVFLHLEWEGREAWRANLLEEKLFQSHRAGEVVFQRIDRILRSRDPIETELAKVYLFALGLGFQGRFRGPGGSERIDTYRRQLHAFVTNEDPDAQKAPKLLFPEAYLSTLDLGEGRRLPYVRRWVGAAVLLLLLWITVSHQVWRGLVEDMEPLIDRILDTGDQIPQGDAPSTS